MFSKTLISMIFFRTVREKTHGFWSKSTHGSLTESTVSASSRSTSTTSSRHRQVIATEEQRTVKSQKSQVTISSSSSDSQQAAYKSADSMKEVEAPKGSERSRSMSLYEEDESLFVPDYDETMLCDSDAQ